MVAASIHPIPGWWLPRKWEAPASLQAVHCGTYGPWPVRPGSSHRQQRTSLPAAWLVLILPWIRCKNLASRVLALISRRLADDWCAPYARPPRLPEIFVDKPRCTGIYYQAANWPYLGDTQGRGKLDTLHRHDRPIKSIRIYPLTRDIRRQICKDSPLMASSVLSRISGI